MIPKKIPFLSRVGIGVNGAESTDPAHGSFARMRGGGAMSSNVLKAPFPYFGGKRRVAELVWGRLGPVDNYIEPFAGSAAMLLCRPDPPRIETLNDTDCYVANFWRATQHDPEQVAYYADSPVNEADLHSRHRWLVLSAAAGRFRRRMRTDPEAYDCRVAGWWCWGLCCWIGGGWCKSDQLDRHENSLPEMVVAKGVQSKAHEQRRPAAPAPGAQGLQGVCGALPREQLPKLASGNKGNGLMYGGSAVHAEKIPARYLADSERRPSIDHNHGYTDGAAGKPPSECEQYPRLSGSQGVNVGDGNRPQLADAYARGRGVHGHDEAGTCAQRRAWLVDWFDRLRDRLRTVRVCCGDWLRVCDSESVTTRLGVTGIFFDPLYAHSIARLRELILWDRGDLVGPVRPRGHGVKSRDANLYASEGDADQVVADAHRYCLERGRDPLMRLALAGYEGEHEELEEHGWECVHWKAQGGYGNRSQKGRDNSNRERLWFSPHCRRPAGLFDFMDTRAEECREALEP
jgi:hypothetical protein